MSRRFRPLTNTSTPRVANDCRVPSNGNYEDEHNDNLHAATGDHYQPSTHILNTMVDDDYYQIPSNGNHTDSHHDDHHDDHLADHHANHHDDHHDDHHANHHDDHHANHHAATIDHWQASYVLPTSEPDR
ncbi:hypothetical protein DPMN_167089 [Dreissena polymorpha]|uniref:Uncharacterized protein n=1 Tax=Dreissena polymorpha TaxID=45954 RepID=A0A9D4F391_DREPO|nr:hypothetical protein DPMN_167089 [Dreissena polymorpha]